MGTMKKHAARVPYIVVAGFLFAFLQTGYFYQLQFWMTSAYPSYVTVTLAWLVGSALGLTLGKQASSISSFGWLGASLCAYYGVLVLLRSFPYHLGWLPLQGLLISISGLQAGHFVAVNRSLFKSASRLFFWENNGFVLGWATGFAGYAWLGDSFHWTAPVLTGLIYWLLFKAVVAGDGGLDS